MLNLAEFKGLVGGDIAALPTAVYFHENQLTYPLQPGETRDLQYALTNFTTALAADAVWFNSAYHREAFFSEMRTMLAGMPDHDLSDRLSEIETRTVVHHPGIRVPGATTRSSNKPPHLIWAARWEYDKNPALLLAGLIELESRGFEFRLSVLGSTFRETPEAFEQIRTRFADRLEHFGYLDSREAYEAALDRADVFISTADHEFFGIAAVEAGSRRCAVALPDRLAYPEVFGDRAEWHDGSADSLADAVIRASRWTDDDRQSLGDRLTERYGWPIRADEMDAAMEAARRRETARDDLT